MVKRRWMRAALAETTADRTLMPWTRGPRRQAMIARRAKSPHRQQQRRA